MKLAFSLVLAALAAAPARAQMYVCERSSSVAAWEHLIDLAGNDLGYVAAGVIRADMLPFEETVSAGGFTATQRSSFGLGRADFLCTAYGTPQSMGYGAGTSAFNLTFDLQAAATYTLEGTFARFIGDSHIFLWGSDTLLIQHDAPTMPAEPFLYTGTLGPGRYRLDVVGQSDFGSVVGSFTVVPAPASTLVMVAALAAHRRRR